MYASKAILITKYYPVKCVTGSVKFVALRTILKLNENKSLLIVIQQ